MKNDSNSLALAPHRRESAAASREPRPVRCGDPTSARFRRSRDFLKVAGAARARASSAAAIAWPRARRRRAFHSDDGRVAGHRRDRRGRVGQLDRAQPAKDGREGDDRRRLRPGNSRSTSGDETRGVRSSYGDKPGQLGELWMLWARER